MLFRAIVAFIALPGMVAGAAPALIVVLDPWRRSGSVGGGVVLGLGVFLLLWCVRDFYRAGRGTLAPWSPPARLVVIGLYRYLRNPMYLSVLIILLGWCLLSGSPLLGGYTCCAAAAFHARVLVHEEPWLARQFGEPWRDYSAGVNRWLPRFGPRDVNTRERSRQ